MAGGRAIRNAQTYEEAYPLSFRAPGDPGRLRGIGNSINPYLAAEFIAAFMDIRGIAPVNRII
jgi:hypothetical protein